MISDVISLRNKFLSAQINAFGLLYLQIVMCFSSYFTMVMFYFCTFAFTYMYLAQCQGFMAVGRLSLGPEEEVCLLTTINP